VREKEREGTPACRISSNHNIDQHSAKVYNFQMNIQTNPSTFFNFIHQLYSSTLFINFIHQLYFSRRLKNTQSTEKLSPHLNVFYCISSWMHRSFHQSILIELLRFIVIMTHNHRLLRRGDETR